MLEYCKSPRLQSVFKRHPPGVGQWLAPLSLWRRLIAGAPSLSLWPNSTRGIALGVADFLRHELARRQRRNAGYSLRAFSRDLGWDHATVSQWMRGKRTVTREALYRICDRLGVSGQGIEQVESFDPFDLIVLDTAVRLERPTVAEVAEACGCTADDVNIALSRMLRLGMLRMEGDRWVALERD